MIAEGSCAIIWTGYFYFISRNAFYFIYFTIGLNLLALFGAFYLTESPRYLFGMENFEECRKVMMTIAKRNKVLDYQEPIFDDEHIVMIEVEDGSQNINPSGPIRTTEPETQQFDHLLAQTAQEESAVIRKTRYMTNAR